MRRNTLTQGKFGYKDALTRHFGYHIEESWHNFTIFVQHFSFKQKSTIILLESLIENELCDQVLHIAINLCSDFEVSQVSCLFFFMIH